MMSVMDYTIARINKGEGVWYGCEGAGISEGEGADDIGRGEYRGRGCRGY